MFGRAVGGMVLAGGRRHIVGPAPNENLGMAIGSVKVGEVK